MRIIMIVKCKSYSNYLEMLYYIKTENLNNESDLPVFFRSDTYYACRTFSGPELWIFN